MNPKLKLEKYEDKALVIWSDSELHGDIMLFKNISGKFCYLEENFITWKVQSTVTLSSYELVFIVAKAMDRRCLMEMIDSTYKFIYILLNY